MCPEWFLLPVEEAHLIVNELHLEKFSDKSYRALALIKWRGAPSYEILQTSFEIFVGRP